MSDSHPFIAIGHLKKAAVLAALYNASRPLGMGFMAYNPEPMTIDQAETLLQRQTDFDYLQGRVMKIRFSGDMLDPRLYDRDNGQGAAARAIASLEQTGTPDNETIAEAHQAGKTTAASRAYHAMGTETESNGSVTTLGLADVKEQLAPAVKKAMEAQ